MPRSEPTTVDPLDWHRLEELVRDHLSPDVARRWLERTAPGVRLLPAGPADRVVARLGGSPAVPASWEWPMHPDLGPLSFSMEVDLAAVDAVAREAVRDLGAWFPKSGRLLAFYGNRGSGADDVARRGQDEDTADGAGKRAARLAHLSARREDCQVRETPGGAVENPLVELTGVVVPTWPDFESYAVGELMSELAAAGQEQAIEDLDALDEALSTFRGVDSWHQVGGWAFPAEWQPEDLTGHPEDSGGLRSRLVLQIDLTPDTARGSAERDWDLDERLYWIARPEAIDVGSIIPDLDFFHQGG